MNFRDNWGSTLPLILGVSMFLGAVGQLTEPNGETVGVLTGPAVIAGALIYRSAKHRRETRKNSAIRIIAEMLGLLVILFPFSLNGALRSMTLAPIPHFIAPVWALIAYAYVALRVLIKK